MSNLVIVAVPDENDHVWRVSSEKVPHLTLLFLGDQENVSNLNKIVEFVEHAARTSLHRFYLSVDRRGELGEDKADVLFFKKNGYDHKAIRNFRAALLQDPNIKTAFDQAQQFEGWTPHLTLGYPEAPAKKQNNEFDGPFYSIGFNKIAIWTGDFEGPEVLLKDQFDELNALESVPMDLSMSALALINDNPEEAMTKAAEERAEKFLAHYGVKGMHWGQRNRHAAPTPVAVSAASRTRKVPNLRPRPVIRGIKVAGGENHPAHEDALRVAKARTKMVKSGPAALSNQELKEVANRLQLELQVKQLNSPSGQKFATGFVKTQGQQSLSRVITRKAIARGF